MGGGGAVGQDMSVRQTQVLYPCMTSTVVYYFYTSLFAPVSFIIHQSGEAVRDKHIAWHVDPHAASHSPAPALHPTDVLATVFVCL